MGLFGNLFGIKDAEKQSKDRTQPLLPANEQELTSSAPELGQARNQQLSSAQCEALESSTLQLRISQLYMHYWMPDLQEDAHDQTWQNMVLFFWKADEPFPRKSLPPVFETFRVKTFVFAGDTTSISVQTAQAMPWFGMPGLGEKHVCLRNGQEIAIPALHQLGLVNYVEPVELTPTNLALLTDREHCFFLVNSQRALFENGRFYLHGQPVALPVAYSAGGVQLVRSVH